MNPDEDEDELPIVEPTVRSGCASCVTALGLAMILFGTIIVVVVGLITSIEWALS